MLGILKKIKNPILSDSTNIMGGGNTNRIEVINWVKLQICHFLWYFEYLSLSIESYH